MQLYLAQQAETQQNITPQLIIANELLAMTAAQLEQTIAQQAVENPALEIEDHERCPYCGSPMQGKHCPYCLDRKALSDKNMDYEGWNYQDYRTRNWDEEEENDPISRIPDGPSLSEYLMWQLGPILPPCDLAIAQHLVGSLDSHGFLTTTAEEVARILHVEVERVQAIIHEIQKLDPPGIGARNSQECLLIQLQRLREDGKPHPIAEAIFTHYGLFLKQHYHALARTLGVTEDKIHEEYEFIGCNCSPYPAHSYWSLGEARPLPDTVYIRPDIAIRRRPAPDEGFEIEVLPAHSFTLQISPQYVRLARELEMRPDPSSQEAQQQIKDYIAKGKLFIRCVNQRWQTLQKIGDWLVNYQTGFLKNGEKAIRPITRAKLAEQIGVHESTVSRAVSNKYALLPNGRVIPLSDFFDDSLAVKTTLLEIVRQERLPLSDQELAGRLKEKGYPIARRTVAKYRQELNILPARLRSKARPEGEKPCARSGGLPCRPS